MKKLMLGLMMAFAATAEAEKLDVEIDGLKYTLDTMRKDATITGYTGSPTKVEVGEVEWEGQKYAVTEVEFVAFEDCGSLISVSLPNVTTIVGTVFQGCENLTSVSLPKAEIIPSSFFRGLTKLTLVDLTSATTIGMEAFMGCSSLTSVLLPNATTIGDEAFRDCRGLTSVLLPNATTIGDKAFRDCSSLTSVLLPKASEIGQGAFSGCDALEVVVLSQWFLEHPDRQRWNLRDEAKLVELYTKEKVENAKIMWKIGDTLVESQGYEMLCAYYGITPKSAQILKEGEIAVTKESIQAAKAETISIANNEVRLGVSVMSNANITAEIAEWGKVKFDENTKVGLSEDGTQLIISIPVAAQQGFMILQSGDAKAVPSNGAKQGFYKLEAR